MSDNTSNILIVEDNVIIADDLEMILQDMGYNVVGNVISYEQAIEVLEKESVDLAIIDIVLATEKTGINVAEYINKNNQIPFIFLTSNSDMYTIAKVKETNPSAYLIKPYEEKNIFAAIEVAISNYQLIENKKRTTSKKKQFIFVKKRDLYVKVLFEDILYVKSDNVYVEIHTLKGDMFIVRSTLKDFALKLPENFYKCSKSYIINIQYVDAYNSKDVILKQVAIPISKDFKVQLKALFGDN